MIARCRVPDIPTSPIGVSQQSKAVSTGQRIAMATASIDMAMPNSSAQDPYARSQKPLRSAATAPGGDRGPVTTVSDGMHGSAIVDHAAPFAYPPADLPPALGLPRVFASESWSGHLGGRRGRSEIRQSERMRRGVGERHAGRHRHERIDVDHFT